MKPRSLREVAGLPIHQAGQACQADECHRRPRQCLAFSAVVVAVAAVAVVAGLAAVAVAGLALAAALRLQGAAGAAAQTSR